MKYDVVVVGAGPAGSTTAKFLAEDKINVLLIDKEKFPRDKSCGGGIPIRLLNKFPYLKEKKLIDTYSYGGYVYISPKQHKISFQKDEPIFASVLRKTFDYGLVKLAIESGVNFLDNTICENIIIEKDKVITKLNNGKKIESEIVVGADGIRSIVAKKSRLAPTKKFIGICLYEESPVKKEILDQYFTEKRLGYLHHKVLGINGFAWAIPKNEHINIGIGELKKPGEKKSEKTNLKEIFKNYIKVLKDQKLIPPQIKGEKILGGVIPIRPLKKTYSDRLLLCGDAAGLVNPSTGAGIEYAMTSGKIAAAVIKEALEENNTSARKLSKYQKLWKKDFGKDIKLFLLIQNRWGRNLEKLIHLIEKDPKFLEMAFGILNGNVRIYKNKWMILRRLLYLYIQDFFRGNT